MLFVVKESLNNNIHKFMGFSESVRAPKRENERDIVPYELHGVIGLRDFAARESDIDGRSSDLRACINDG